RLRKSARLAVLVLLVFSLNLGTVAACTQHDLADLGLGASGDHAADTQLAHASETPDRLGDALGHASACSHCGCHHAFAPPNTVRLVAANQAQGRAAFVMDAAPAAIFHPDLRPPIV